MYKCHVTFKLMEACCVIWGIKARPLSDCMLCDKPNQGIMFCSNILVTVSAVPLVVRKASIHAEKVQTSIFIVGHVYKVYLPILTRSLSLELVSEKWRRGYVTLWRSLWANLTGKGYLMNSDSWRSVCNYWIQESIYSACKPTWKELLYRLLIISLACWSVSTNFGLWNIHPWEFCV